MNQLKVVFPFLSALGVYFLALSSPMYQHMNQPHSVENEIKSIPVENLKWSKNRFSAPLRLLVSILQRSQLSFWGMMKGVKSFIRPPDYTFDLIPLFIGWE